MNCCGVPMSVMSDWTPAEGTNDGSMIRVLRCEECGKLAIQNGVSVIRVTSTTVACREVAVYRESEPQKPDACLQADLPEKRRDGQSGANEGDLLG